ncbi:DUF4214 domain-containing protein [Massilia sp. HP4]|uniref:DUF4214 domain-containing protein n=1 Tax=Massilia sp. HP4 TaxID=2562316 RepID=UPI0010C083F7|nr:DUF4214 domain-containing protein [Massilia sp. HP4]
MYDTNATAISNQLKATSAQFFSDDTISSILELISTPDNNTIVANNVQAANNTIISESNGVDIVFVETSATERTNVSVTADIPAVFFQGAGGVNASIGNAPASSASGNSSAAVIPGDEIERVVVGTAGADTITIVDGKNTQVVAGDGDVVNAGTGHTIVIAAQGSSTVNGGGNTVVQATGAEGDFTVTVTDGVASIENSATGVSVELNDVNLVTLDDGDALVFADTEDEAAVANLYHAVLGRNADYSGLEFWYDRVEEGISMQRIAQAFLDSAEYTGDTQTNEQFIDALYENLLERDADTSGVTFWNTQLDGGVSRADVLVAFAQASVDGTEVDVVGSVTILDPTA